ncbi:FAD-binding oxidoreductase [Rhodophyticola sp. CCM32]|uniref:FAD-binding oxidoreductase n=1 Tax=Rhodophyticola sp. CCM32 TaxID=2916397 RepID=UPI00107EEDBF|nr:FAD-binding oxidoreductase [Rhodophyticola sp. CCM32]QBY02758.1 FAD-binding oxidoreductase [Rhodophyticola sp. CCM32]
MTECFGILQTSGITVDDAPGPVERKSRDFFWYSPILKRQLADIRGDFLAIPETEDEVRKILATCFEHDVPVTVRGAGTGNYGQAMPLRGGCVLLTERLDQIGIHTGHVVAGPGAIMRRIEDRARETDQEIRLFPSTMATATIGGFIAGGSSGVGAIRWGGLRNPANIRRIRLLTMEAEPQVIELTGHDVHKAAHAYGVNGIITELELPIDPATDWREVLIGLPDMAAAIACAFAIGRDDAILSRMISLFEPGIADRYFLRHRKLVPEGEALVAVYVASGDLAALEALIARLGGQIRFRDGEHEGRFPDLYELGWNHTTLRAIKVDPAMTYLQMMFSDDVHSDAAAIKARFGDELQIHMEFTRIQGEVRAVAMPLVRFTDEARLEEVVTILEGELGLTVFNPHRVTLEEGGMKAPDLDQLEFKRRADPKGLLNPGKMIAWEDPDWVPQDGRSYLFGTVGGGRT